MDAWKNKLDFGRPPVKEVVLSILFEPLDKLLAPHLGEIWRELRREGFVEIKEHQLVPPIVETFPNPSRSAHLQINVPDLARVWFIHEDDSQIIQVQRDRFTFNWRKTESNPRYPGFSSIFKSFENLYIRFGQIIGELGIGEVVPLQYELTYIDQLVRGEGWDTFDDIGQIYTIFIHPQQSDPFWNDAEFVNFRTSFSASDLQGRLHLAIGNRVRTSDQMQTLQTDFTMRGFPLNAEDPMSTWFKLAHDQIRAKFVSIFTEDIQTDVWERK